MSKVYDKPDRSVSHFWECENSKYPVVVYETGNVKFVYPNSQSDVMSPEANHGRWRPYIANNPEPWPPKKLMPRRCWATYQGERKMLVWFTDGHVAPFRDAFYEGRFYNIEELTNIVYIDPEQEALEEPQ